MLNYIVLHNMNELLFQDSIYKSPLPHTLNANIERRCKVCWEEDAEDGADSKDEYGQERYSRVL